MDQVDEVKGKADIVAVIGEHMRLTKAGRHFKGLCPFHEEHTPSFMVSPELQIYKCFGCGESGDVYTFLQKREGMEFYEALKYLADRVGVKLTPRSGQDASIKSQVIEANELAAKFYHYILTKHSLGKSGLDYLTSKRGLSMETIKKFNLGFAPQNRSILFEALSKKKKINGEVLEKAGLVFRTRGGYMDRFRERVIFPIESHRGEVVALAGRILPEFDTGKVGKYINSPETPVYHKSSSLFGFSVTKEQIRKAHAAVIVEGELDFLSSWQAGVENIVAIKGTALTMEHVRVLSRFAETLIMALDSDFAGDAAAIRGLSFAQNAGLEVKVASLGEYKDPDDFARADPNGFNAALKNAIDAWEFVINVTARRYSLATGAGKAKASRQIIPILSSIEDNIVRSHYAQRAAAKLGVPVEAVVKEVEKQGKAPRSEQETKNEPVAKSRRELLEERLLVLAISEPGVMASAELKSLLLSPLNLKIAKAILSFINENDSLDVSKFGASLASELKGGFAALLMQEELAASPHEVKLVKEELRELILRERLSKLSGKITSLEEKGDEDALQEIQKKFQTLSKELSRLTRNA